jgi:ubiquinone biosynthesis protein COQ4
LSAAVFTCRTFYGMKAKYHFLKYVQNPTNTPGIFEMTESFQKAALPEVINTLLKPLLENSDMKKAYENRYWPEVPSFQDLKVYPKESFGYKAYQFFEHWNLDPDLFPPPDFSSPQSYITSRIYQAHDFWHVLTGYDTSLENELALQAFGVGQYKQPISLAIIAGGLMHLLQKTPENASEILALISEGFERGMKTHNLLTATVLERLHDPLIEVQNDLNIPERSFFE